MRRAPVRVGGGSRSGDGGAHLNLCAAVFVSPAFTCTVTEALPRSGWMKVTVCDPAGTLTPTLGVLPRGLPSSTTLETGIELMLSVPVPEAEPPAPLDGGGSVGPGPG